MKMLFLLADLLMGRNLFGESAGVAVAAENPGPADMGFGAEASHNISVFLWLLLLIPAVPLSIFIIKKIIRYIRDVKEKNFIEQMKLDAKNHEKAGEFVSAGMIYEKLKDIGRAAVLYEKGGDFSRAAAIYEMMGQLKKVREMYERAGDIEKAAEICVISGDHIEAARLYNSLGDKLRAAQALEMSGNRMAAVRAYREARDYVRAAELLSEEGMYKEAAEMYKISLAGEEPASINIDKFYAYARMLEVAGENDQAISVFEKIAKINQDYRDVSSRLETAGVKVASGDSEPGKEALPDTSPAVAPGMTLRSFLRAGRMEPRYSLRLWVQILKSLDKTMKDGKILSNISPDSISIDAQNNVMFLEDLPKDFAYMAPETISGGMSDQVSAVYSLGVILYEMLTGNLDSMGIKKPGEVMTDVPSWLEELAVKCLVREREGRYQGFNEIYSALKALKSRM